MRALDASFAARSQKKERKTRTAVARCRAVRQPCGVRGTRFKKEVGGVLSTACENFSVLFGFWNEKKDINGVFHTRCYLKLAPGDDRELLGVFRLEVGIGNRILYETIFCPNGGGCRFGTKVNKRCGTNVISLRNENIKSKTQQN